MGACAIIGAITFYMLMKCHARNGNGISGATSTAYSVGIVYGGLFSAASATTGILYTMTESGGGGVATTEAIAEMTASTGNAADAVVTHLLEDTALTLWVPLFAGCAVGVALLCFAIGRLCDKPGQRCAPGHYW